MQPLESWHAGFSSYLQLQAGAVNGLGLCQLNAAARKQAGAEHDPVGRVRLHAVDQSRLRFRVQVVPACISPSSSCYERIHS
jgi:hypothetical protein